MTSPTSGPDGTGPNIDAAEERTVAAMPAVWAGRRRRLLVFLAVLGVLQALLAVIMALTVASILSPEVSSDPWDLAALLGSVLGIGLARWMERVLAEDLGQHYVSEQRRRLVTAAIGDADYSQSLGVTVTRASNDLSALRNWVALGIVPLVTGVPLIAVLLAALFVYEWHIGVAVAAPLVLIGSLLPSLSRLTLERARRLRRRRGRMSARIADTVLAGESVRVAGAVQREVRAVDRESSRVVTAAVDRAWITGLTRSLTATAASLSTVGVVVLSMLGTITSAEVASVMTLLGVLATPVGDLGRVVEYRQNYRAATLILAPVLGQADQLRAQERDRLRQWRDEYDGLELDPDRPRGVRVSGLIANDRHVPDLTARPGERVRMVATDPHHLRVVMGMLSGFGEEGVLSIDGHDYGVAPGKIRRMLVGMASEHIPLERGSIRRLVSFRAPAATDAEVEDKLVRVGLWDLVQADLRGWNLKLKNDGQPWSIRNVTLLKIARAMLGHPPLLVLEGVDNLLDDAAVARVRRLLADYEGVVVFSSAAPGDLVGEYSVWNVDGVEVDPEERGDDDTPPAAAGPGDDEG
ncbi:ABC transporter transmembrane domain-containing protein [Corynebacterium guangdongense]|uniref:ABC-type multidrug transport system fused ATPase/permease subunit n=1 Tax=Corynebacterium guangdongense TaxID=1783348 RepID=A0ABU1ZW35_9CORY|nr:ABC transporter ATP-binding protein [Corynebacterium guangdongense]MDR7329154.1 ABC-type multidrug transport system fused ATPase/permease subunit [Corynebacterium guangdongense]WJZ17723.1 Putative multidrug export ATP-binding/permease protein [Corynebacterium guangdongense]